LNQGLSGPEWSKALAATKAKEVDMASADSSLLRYHLFPGDVVVVDESVDFSARRGWVQVLDFASGLTAVEAALERNDEARFEFTESDAALNFCLENGDVCVASTYATGLMRVGASAFRQQVERFVRRVVRDLCRQYPRLALNPEIRRIDILMPQNHALMS
jgi:hypothetical protein